MTLIKSISGIRGTIGGVVGDNLTPLDIVKFASAYGVWIRSKSDNNKIVIGRDARISGSMVQNLVMNTLVGLGFDVVDIGLSTTPTVEIAVPLENASGGIIITASHNPKQWNALKLLNSKGEFLNSDDGIEILKFAESTDLKYNDIDSLGKITEVKNYIDDRKPKKETLTNLKVTILYINHDYETRDGLSSSLVALWEDLFKYIGIRNKITIFIKTYFVFFFNSIYI